MIETLYRIEHETHYEHTDRATTSQHLACLKPRTLDYQRVRWHELVVDPLPDDVKKKVVWRDRYWLTDEALSTYVRSAGLFGNEMHSPIMAVSNGIPAIVCRFDEQTKKGYMWRDIGLDDCQQVHFVDLQDAVHPLH